MQDKDKIENKSLKDRLIWLCVTVLALAGIVIHYYYANVKKFYYFIGLGWVVFLLSAAFMLYYTALGKKFVRFCKEAQGELRKILWPTKKEAMQVSFMVIVVVLVVAVLLWFLDSLLFLIISYITGQKG